jgi:hypothetical protein
MNMNNVHWLNMNIRNSLGFKVLGEEHRVV